MLVLKNDVEKLMKERVDSRILWGSLIGFGAVVALGAGFAISKEIDRRHKRLPASGSYESIRSENFDLVDGTSVRLTFDNGWMDVYAGGNDMTGTVAMIGAKLFWSEEDSTQVGVMPHVAIQDARLSRWLNSGVTFYRDHSRLVLSDGVGKLVFKKIDDPI